MSNRHTTSYQCRLCRRPFTTTRALLRHNRETRCHENDVSRVHKKYKCTKCSDVFSRDFDRRRHERRRHTNHNGISVGAIDPQTITPSEPLDPQSGSQQAISPPHFQINAPLEELSVCTPLAQSPSIGFSHRKRTYGDIEAATYFDSGPIGIENLSLGGDDRPRHKRNPNGRKPILCTICRQPFDTNNPQLLDKHLNRHFRGFSAINRCEECGIDFIEKADLDTHRDSVATKGHCGFHFHHTEPCTGHRKLSNWQMMLDTTCKSR